MKEFFQNSLILNAAQAKLMHDLKEEMHEMKQNQLAEINKHNVDLELDETHDITEEQFRFDFEEDFG